ncbi:MAG: hypothetical protein ACEQSM_07430 [Aliarcobacter sp.]
MAIIHLPASALYSHPSLARLWKKVHLTFSPFYHRPAVRRLYTQPATVLRVLLRHAPYNFIALGCAEGLKESLLLRKLPKPALLLTADTCLSMAKFAARKLPARTKIARQIDLTSPSSISCILTPPTPNSKSKAANPARLITLFGVLPNLDPLPLLRCLAKHMAPKDLLLFSSNLAPGKNGRWGACRVLPQYDNPLTHKWLQGVVLRTRPRLSPGSIKFGVYPDTTQSSLSRIEARWFVGSKATHTLFSSRRPTLSQVESWIRTSGLTRIHQWIEPKGEEGVWLTTRKA